LYGVFISVMTDTWPALRIILDFIP
jgi:hypothetical protein